MPTARDLLEEGAGRLEVSGVPTPEVDAELLLGHLLGLGRGSLQAKLITGLEVTEETATAFDRLIERRSAREPLQHITGTAGFRSIELQVGPGVFVPRPETEGVAQIAIDALRSVAEAEPIAVDLGTGSGALALSLAHEVPHASVFGVENSVEAYIWARRNRYTLALENARIVFIDLAEALPELDGTVAVVVSNPPYIPDAAIPRDPEVRLFDPPAALYGGEDGLDVVRHVSATARRLLRPGGTLVIEHGELQGAEIRALLEADGWRMTATHRDLTLRDRTTTAVR
ncbi:peptide chain release factor N(5)-glutamine methyltransferase [Microbacteriaceae bacterium VKM Ac-2854]|nr:peptide chain release factor N(5)-glutamine methyltransferase [Microbacteriaceae bacterium VKM Ac-2854]